MNGSNVGLPERKTSEDVSVPQRPPPLPGEQLSTLWLPPPFVQRTVSPGLLFVPFHFAESAANVLTHRTLDPVAKIPETKVTAVRVAKIG